MEEYFSIKSLAQLWKIPKSSVYELVRKKRLQHVRVGKHIRISRSVAEEYLKSQANN